MKISRTHINSFYFGLAVGGACCSAMRYFIYHAETAGSLVTMLALAAALIILCLRRTMKERLQFKKAYFAGGTIFAVLLTNVIPYLVQSW
jgi:hypothetical protein